MRKTMKTTAILAAMSVMVLGTVATVSAAGEKDSWVERAGSWYYVDGKGSDVVNKWVKAGDKWYFLGEDGKMVTNRFVIDSVAMKSTDIVDYYYNTIWTDDIYYVGSDGAMVTGWQEFRVGGDTVGPTKNQKEWFYFGDDGRAYAEQWVKSGGSWYYIDTDGKMATSQIIHYDGDDFYLNKDGKMIDGWYKVTGTDDTTNLAKKDMWVYADKDGILAQNEWVSINNKWYRFGNDSLNYKGNAKDDVVLEVIEGGSCETAKTPYGMNQDQVIKIGSESFYLSSNGDMLTGWIRQIDVDGDNVKDYFYAGTNGVLKAAGSNKLFAAESIANQYHLFGEDYVWYTKDARYTNSSAVYAGDARYAVRIETTVSGAAVEVVVPVDANMLTTLTGSVVDTNGGIDVTTLSNNFNILLPGEVTATDTNVRDFVTNANKTVGSLTVVEIYKLKTALKWTAPMTAR